MARTGSGMAPTGPAATEWNGLAGTGPDWNGSSGEWQHGRGPVRNGADRQGEEWQQWHGGERSGKDRKGSKGPDGNGSAR